MRKRERAGVKLRHPWSRGLPRARRRRVPMGEATCPFRAGKGSRGLAQRVFQHPTDNAMSSVDLIQIDSFLLGAVVPDAAAPALVQVVAIAQGRHGHQGTGSYPLLPNGRHRPRRLTPSHVPFNTPYLAIASCV